MKRLLILIFLPVIIAGWVADASALTMEEAVSFALKNNHRIKQFENLEGSAREDIGSRRSAFFPSANLTYSYTELDTKGNTTSTFNRDASVATAEASYNLFNGLSDLKGLKEAEARADAAAFERQATEADVALDTKTAYIEILRARRVVETASEGVELLQRQKHDAELFYREGLFAKNDVLKVAVELSSAGQDLIRAEGDLRVAKKRLERVTGVSLGEDETIMDVEGLPETGDISYKELSAVALEGRSELHRLRALEEAYRYSMESLRGGYLPRLDLSVSHSSFGDTASPDGRESLHDSEVRATVTATWNVFDGFSRKHDIAGARYLREATGEQIKDTEEEVLLQLKEAIESYQVSLGRLVSAGTAVGQAEENYRVTDNQFRERLATTTDLLDARFFLTRARNQRNEALYDLHLWAARIERVVEGYGNSPASVEDAGTGPDQ
jgi:outer membrane protein TolC